MLKLLVAATVLVPSLALVESRRLEKTRVDRAIAKGITSLKIKPRVRVRPVVTKSASAQDNSNSSYAALGVRVEGAPWPPPWTPAWLWTPVWRLGQGMEAIQTLKDACWKGIVAASYSK